MDFISVRDLRIQPAEIWRQLREKRDLVLTSNGRPIAVIVGVEADEVKELLVALRRARAQMAVSRMRRSAAEWGVNQLGAEAIEAEIAEARRERRP